MKTGIPNLKHDNGNSYKSRKAIQLKNVLVAFAANLWVYQQTRKCGFTDVIIIEVN